MFINCVKEGDEISKGKEFFDVNDTLEDYHTSNELFKIMAKNNSQNFDVLENETFPTRDLVILYENIDLSTKLVDNSIVNNKPTNQYVETVIYNDDLSEDSDVCEIYSSEDLHNVVTINNERINLLTTMTSFENTLCHKFGNVHLKTSNYFNEYNKQMLCNDPLNNSKQSDSAVLPTSLLDYICCKRLDDNYNFYLDNIIHYVQNTIEHLKRISNGDYLTDRVKEKWREVDNAFDNETKENDKVIGLSSAHNGRLPVVGKVSDLKNTWNETVHSEMDVRSISKILQKKIVVEIPKILCGSYGIFSKNFSKNLALSCKKVKRLSPHEIKKKSSIEVLLQIQRPEAGIVCACNINPVIVLKTIAPLIQASSENNSFGSSIKELEYIKVEDSIIVELHENENNTIQQNITESNVLKNDCSLLNKNNFEKYIDCDLASDDHSFGIQQLNAQPLTAEEQDCFSKKKKSPTRVRIKSPYENKSYILEERKRKRLLEIRENREKKKLAMSENCKITKHKYMKGAIMAQSSNSVTKLSITNKSFYNSIYGQTNNASKSFRSIITENKEDSIPGIDFQEEYEEKLKEDQSGQSVQKYINRSYYLDDADTEIMYLQRKANNKEDESNEILTPSTSILSSDVGGNSTTRKNLITRSTTDFSDTDTTSSLHQNILMEGSLKPFKPNDCHILTEITEITVPTNTPKKIDNNRKDKHKKITTSVECKKSIDKIYDLMKKMTVPANDLGSSQIENNNNNTETSIIGISTEQTIIQENNIETNVECFDFEKSENSVIDEPRKIVNKKIETSNLQSTTVLPKVIISSKFQPETKIKENKNKTRKENKNTDLKFVHNPLKAISQLLHEFDNVQKTRYKNVKGNKPYKKPDNITVENIVSNQLASKNNTRESKHIKLGERGNGRFLKPLSDTKALKFSQNSPKEDKFSYKNKLADIIDEVKEMRGEAVRGPTKRTSRIDNLAQPKKMYVQAHNEDFKNKYSKNFIPRVQKLTIAPVSNQDKSPKIFYKNRQNRSTGLSPLPKQTSKTGPHLEKIVNKSKRSDNSSQVENEKHFTTYAIKSPHTEKIEGYSLDIKMVAVENYVKNHFGRTSPTQRGGSKNIRVSRVPLIPTDIDVASLASSPIAEESKTLGNKLHNIINTKINSNSEYNTITDEEKDKRMDTVDHSSKCGTTLSTSDHPVDIMEDKNIITAVACLSKEKTDCKTYKNKSSDIDVSRNEIEEIKSCFELQRLENALYRKITSGTFQKRLTIKNLTLTPKQSTQQVFVLQSIDAKSVIMKSTLSKESISKMDGVSKLNILPVMSHNAINFNLPMQIATVGYVFPTYQIFNKNSNENIKTYKNVVKSSLSNIVAKYNIGVDKTVQCYKGDNEKQSLKQKTDAKSTDSFNKSNIYTEAASDIPKDIFSQQQSKDIGKEVFEPEYVKMKNSENISNSTSLDILLGLLNEIKNITSCQTFTAVSEIDNFIKDKEIKVILNNSAVHDNSIDHSEQNSNSTSSIDYQTHLCPSNLALILKPKSEDFVGQFQLAKDNKLCNINKIKINRLFSDKEIGVQISRKEVVHRLTDVPSRFIPSTITRSTDVIRSLIDIANKNDKSINSYSDCHIIFSNTTFTNINDTSSKIQVKKQKTNFKNINIFSGTYDIERKSKFCLDKCKAQEDGKNYSNLLEFDSLIKIKRDVLVTVYSILVLTVFAAFTIPEIISHAGVF